jgi:hypothetical protein
MNHNTVNLVDKYTTQSQSGDAVDVFRKGILNVLSNCDTDLGRHVLLIIRSYAVAPKCDLRSRRKTLFSHMRRRDQDICYQCTHTCLVGTQKVYECLRRRHGGVIINVGAKDRKRFMPVPDEETANKYGMSLHVPSTSCLADCGLCRSIVENYYVPINKSMGEMRYVSYKDLFVSICPFHLVRNNCARRRLEKYGGSEAVNMDNYVTQFKGDIDLYQRNAAAHKSYTLGYCGLCGSQGTLYGIIMNGHMMHMCRESKRAIPCWKYYCFEEPNWEAEMNKLNFLFNIT